MDEIEGIEPPFDTAWAAGCDGCGRDEPLDPAEVDGRVVMLCERCYRESADG